MEKTIEELGGRRPGLCLHACCAPCSSHCLEVLAPYFDICVFYYNPNITERAEYEHRVSEERRLLKELGADLGMSFSFAEGAYEPESFIELSRGLESCPEGGERCRKCFELRLDVAAGFAASRNFEYFTTTLTISPLKDAQLLNELGLAAGERYGVKYLTSDFKKKEGAKRSIELSKKYGLYRQDYCGCAFSKAEREKQKKEKDHETISGSAE